MIRIHSLLTILFLMTSPLLGEKASISITTDRSDAIYSIGEEVTFLIKVLNPPASSDADQIIATLSKDGVSKRPPIFLDISSGTTKLRATLNEPGFLRLTVEYETLKAKAAAGFDPKDLGPSLPIPEDFDEFWKSQKKKLAAVPINPSLKPVSSNINGIKSFDVKLDSIGSPVRGYFSKPLKAEPKSLPAILIFHGAGVRSSNLANTTRWASKLNGILAFEINAHGIPNGMPSEFYQDLAENKLRGYRHYGRNDREQSYFLEMFLRAKRAIDFLTEQPEWDGEILVLFGTSQGAFQAFAGAALDSRVSFICAGVPAGSDHTGFLLNRASGWPQWVSLDREGNPNILSKNASRYFDNVNFAKRIRNAEVAITVGLIDTVCPPTTVYVTYNALSVPKTLHVDPLAGHINTQQAWTFLTESALRHMQEKTDLRMLKK